MYHFLYGGVLSLYQFIDLFSGIGGIRLGLERAGLRCVFSSEWDTAARTTYEQNFGEKPFGDITTLSDSEILRLPSFDILAAGFPCQPFSICGLKEGFADTTKGTLFFNILHIATLRRPAIVFLENVAHLARHDGGNTLRTIEATLSDLGYHVSHQILDASSFEVPQHRKRIFIVASLKPGFTFPTGRPSTLRLRDILDSNVGKERYFPKESYTLLTEMGVEPKASPNGLIFSGFMNKNLRKNGVRPDTIHLSRSHRQINRIYSIDGLHPTLAASETSGRYYILDDVGVRKLTLDECFRLQGFPSDFVRPSSEAQQYHQIGNTVSVPVIEALATSLMNHLTFT